MTARDFNFVSFLLRFAFAAALVFLTYNPSGVSWVGYMQSDVPKVYLAASGIVLLIGWVMYLRATWNSLGALGTILALAFFGIIIWLFYEWEFFTLEDTTIIQWLVEFIVAGVLAIGMSWSHIRRKISGQYDTDEIEG